MSHEQITDAERIEHFIRYCHIEKRYSIHTVNAYRRDIRQFQSALLKKDKIASVITSQSADIQEFVASLHRQGQQPKENFHLLLMQK